MLNYNTTCHFSIGCEPSKVFHGRIPYTVLDHKKELTLTKFFCQHLNLRKEVQQRTQLLIDKTNNNIKRSYLKYKGNYDRKAKAAPPKGKDYCFILQPKADSQATKIPFAIPKILPNDIYIAHRVNTNKTQTLH